METSYYPFPKHMAKRISFQKIRDKSFRKKNLLSFVWGRVSLGLILFSALTLRGQTPDFPFELILQPFTHQGFPGVHSFAFGQKGKEYLLIGGRLDGVHARQPFNAFPYASANQKAYVFNFETGETWEATLSTLPTDLVEQLSSTNLNFAQSNDTLVIAGGYGFSATANNHVSFPRLTLIHLSGFIQAIKQGQSLQPHVESIVHQDMAVTGGQMVKWGKHWILVGGHRFDGRYNPMGNPTFTQSYTNAIRWFRIQNSSSGISIITDSLWQDAVHLRRRDYNLVPMQDTGGLFYMVSAGVFQVQADLPFLYPVEIRKNGYQPRTDFSQYLSHYHNAKVGLWDAQNKVSHAIFIGGISQYFYQNGQLVQDDQVPFVKTLSRVSRNAQGQWFESVFTTTLTDRIGSGAEFFPHAQAPWGQGKVIQMNAITQDTILIGYRVGGILSQSDHPFSNNQTSQTTADATLHAIYLVKSPDLSLPVSHSQSYALPTLVPNPVKKDFEIRWIDQKNASISYWLVQAEGRIIEKGTFFTDDQGHASGQIPNLPAGVYQLLLRSENGRQETLRLLIH